MPYDWAGTRILQENTAFPGKRFVLGYQDQSVLTDLREWMGSVDSEEIRRVMRTLTDLPKDKTPGTFDERARVVWRWLVRNVEYVEDPEAHLKQDFWQFPAETLALKKGDCEDCSFLLATLLLASGISAFCVRVVWGQLKTARDGGYTGHVWPVYKDEKGSWRILESTLAKQDWTAKWPQTGRWPEADQCVKRGVIPRYRPDLCLNDHHVWLVSESSRSRVGKVAEYVSRHRKERQESTTLPKPGTEGKSPRT